MSGPGLSPLVAPGLFLRRRPEPLLVDLVDWWDLDLANGGTGRAGNFNLTKVGSATQTSSGGPGGVGYTEASTNANISRYTLAHDAAFDSAAPLSFSVWARVPDPLIGTATVFYRICKKGFFCDINSNSTTTPTLIGSRFWTANTVQASNRTPWNGWNHWTYVRDDAGTNRIYLNGAAVASSATAATTTDTGLLYVMSDNAGGYNPDTCMFAWWSRALVAADVTRLYGGGTPLTASNIGL
jgi:hypothetical protein